MRVSSLSFYANTLSGIRDQQSSIARLSQQIATGDKYFAAKDAPVETARALQLASQIATRTQFQANQTKADLTLKEVETVLGEMSKAIATAQNISSGTVSTQNQPERDQLAIQINNLYKHIKDLANYRDSEGNYIFAGHQTDTAPYSHDSLYDGVAATLQVTTANGDAGVRQAEIENGRYLETNVSLSSMMEAGNADDLLRQLDDLATKLRDGPLAQTDLDDTRDVLAAAMDGLRSVQSEVAGRRIEVEDVRSSSRSLVAYDQDALDKLQQLDQAAAIVELQQRQVALQAAESAFGLTSKQSLFNYL